MMMMITPNDAQVEFRLTKNRRKTGKRFIRRLKNAKAIFGRPFPIEIQRQPVPESDDNEYPFRVAYVSVHRELVDIGRRCALPPATTYSFRNIYMERIFEHCNYVWQKIIEYTGHLEVDTVKAYYDRMRPPA